MSGFLNSAEIQSEHVAASNSKFVTLLSNNALARHPNPNGFANRVDLLNKGVSCAHVVKALSESGELINSTFQKSEDFLTGDSMSQFQGAVTREPGVDYLAGGIGADEIHFKSGERGNSTIVDFGTRDMWRSKDMTTLIFSGHSICVVGG